jgi:hypothetical protein
MVREQQLKSGLAVLSDLGSICEDLGAVSVDGIYAGGYERTSALDLA